jgi:hypothetical protein
MEFQVDRAHGQVHVDRVISRDGHLCAIARDVDLVGSEGNVVFLRRLKNPLPDVIFRDRSVNAGETSRGLDRVLELVVVEIRRQHHYQHVNDGGGKKNTDDGAKRPQFLLPGCNQFSNKGFDVADGSIL